jgi:hypothetical protein
MYRLIYKSRSVGEIDWDVVKDILHRCEKNNAKNDITGVLLATNTHFLQVLEGRYEDVNKTFMRIVKDALHSEIQLIAFSLIDSRIFKHWGMKGIGVFNLNKEVEFDLIQKYGEEEGGVKFPLEEWMALAMINDIDMVHQLPGWKT